MSAERSQVSRCRRPGYHAPREQYSWARWSYPKLGRQTEPRRCRRGSCTRSSIAPHRPRGLPATSGVSWPQS
ncbi:MAG: hypothetical protein F4155_05720 [Acidimicrobiales bacterium]|nr:hypothetical protein [Acidimicrobiales bacterium]MYH74284.1 hypothetical protein [Acidimicrobiales bacterium]MYK71425.1 hypothetical protein [Acidimicrobiales bacterium]